MREVKIVEMTLGELMASELWHDPKVREATERALAVVKVYEGGAEVVRHGKPPLIDPEPARYAPEDNMELTDDDLPEGA